MGRNRDTSSIGGGLAARVTEQLVRGKLSAAERLAPHVVRTGMALQDEFFRLTSAEIKATTGPLWTQLADHPASPEWLRKTTNFLGRGTGQWQTLLAGSAVGAGMGGGLISLLTNEMNPAVTALIAANPHLQLSPAEVAAATVRGVSALKDPVQEAARSGIDRDRFYILQELNTTVLAPAEIVELYRRGEVDYTFALALMHRAGFNGDHAKRYLTLSRVYVSLADAGQMWNRSIVTTDELVTIAKLNGYSETDAHRYAELGGEPPAPQALYTAFRRGIIDQTRLRRGIVQGPIRNEWFDVLEALQYHSMTPEQAAGAVTQGHLTLDRGQAVAKEYGLNPSDFETLVETAGRPPGVEFASEAWLRGFISDAEYDAMFLESAIKNRYLPVLRKMRTRLIPQETARSLLAKGVITVERCTEILHQHGFSPEDAEALIAAATVEKTQPTRDLSLATVRQLYQEQEITADDAAAMLASLGYDEHEVALELALADVQRLRTYRNAVITKVRSGYVKGLLDETQVTTTLDGLNVPPGRREELIQIWNIERDTVTRDLTPAQLVSAAAKGFMNAATALARLVGQGYAAEDARVLLRIGKVAGV